MVRVSREFKILDEHPGTHFDAPTHFVPPPGFKITDYNAGKWMQERARRSTRAKWGKLPHSTMTTTRSPSSSSAAP